MDETTLSCLVGQVMERLFVEMEASGRHVHLTRQQIQTLFGHDLTPVKPLSQPGQFAAKERLDLIGPKGQLKNVAVLGPARKEAQVEISLTDARGLGLTVPAVPALPWWGRRARLPFPKESSRLSATFI